MLMLVVSSKMTQSIPPQDAERPVDRHPAGHGAGVVRGPGDSLSRALWPLLDIGRQTRGNTESLSIRLCL